MSRLHIGSAIKKQHAMLPKAADSAIDSSQRRRLFNNSPNVMYRPHASLYTREKSDTGGLNQKFEILLCPASLAKSRILARGFICDVPETCLFGSCKLSPASAPEEPRLWKEAVQPRIANEQFLPISDFVESAR